VRVTDPARPSSHCASSSFLFRAPWAPFLPRCLRVGPPAFSSFRRCSTTPVPLSRCCRKNSFECLRPLQPGSALVPV